MSNAFQSAATMDKVFYVKVNLTDCFTKLCYIRIVLHLIKNKHSRCCASQRCGLERPIWSSFPMLQVVVRPSV